MDQKMDRYLVDTDLIIEFSRKSKKAADFLESLDEIIISVITAGEVYQGVRNKKELESAKKFFQKIKVLPINEQCSKFLLELLEKYTLSDGLLILDALIAATAICHNLTLITGNIKHFKMIKELKFENWNTSKALNDHR